MLQRVFLLLVPLTLGVACEADPTTAAGALAPKASQTKSPTQVQPLAPKVSPTLDKADTLRHRSHAVTILDFTELASPTPTAPVHRVEVEPKQTPSDDQDEPTSK